VVRDLGFYGWRYFAIRIRYFAINCYFAITRDIHARDITQLGNPSMSDIARAIARASHCQSHRQSHCQS
jgi:hypothetical protein